jgi:superfamily II DNA or RNA helicase
MSQPTVSPEASWVLTEPSNGLQILAQKDAIHIRAPNRPLESPRDLIGFTPRSRLGRVLPAAIAQLLESGAATVESGDFRIPYHAFCALEEHDFDAFDELAPWSPFVIELESTGSLGSDRFRYNGRFYLGTQAVHLTRRGCFVRRGSATYRLDPQTFALVSAVEEFNALPQSLKTSPESVLRFATIKDLADGVGAELDEYLRHERVLVPTHIGLDLVTDSEGRITFVPKVDGVPDKAMSAAFLALDDVETCYTCALEDGRRVRVVLSEDQREALRRMQRIRRLGGAERTAVLRNPAAVFDGINGAVDLNLPSLGPRVRGIGDFPFVVQPYLQRSATGIFDDPEANEFAGTTRFSAGLECAYVDGTTSRIEFRSRDQITQLRDDAQQAWRSGLGYTSFDGKSITVDRPLLRALDELDARLSPKQKIRRDDSSRRFLLIYTNENELEYEESSGEAGPPPDVQIPAALAHSVSLMDHQRQGLGWLQRNFTLGRRGCLLADDMGLGKTFQTLLFLAWLIENGYLSEEASSTDRAPWNPILIVAPVVLIENETWLTDMRRLFRANGDIFQPWLVLRDKNLKQARVENAKGAETVIGAPLLDLDRLRQHRVVLTNYETVTNYQHSFAAMKDRWTVVVTDEAQEFKTPSTKISHALKSMNPRFRIACTGTPVETRLLDVWNLFDYLQPGKLLGSSSEFSARFERPNPQGAARETTVTQLNDLRRSLHYGQPDAFVLRREKSEILTDLPKKHEHHLRCALSENQRKCHVDVVVRARAGGPMNHPLSLLRDLMCLSQHPSLLLDHQPLEADEALADCPKLQELVERLGRIQHKGEKALVFTRYIKMQDLLSRVLRNKFGIAGHIINGATSRHGDTQSAHKTRKQIIESFKQSPGFDALILSPDVAGIGLTLTEANHVFHYGRWWNPAKESQATDRVYRIGQTKPVHVYYLIAVDPLGQFKSFDEKLDALIERRRKLAEDFLAPMPPEDELGQELVREILSTETGTTTPLPGLGETDINSLPWDQFEALTAALFSKKSSDVILTPRTADEGVDVIAFKYPNVKLIQCKHTPSGSVDADVIAEMIQAFDGYRFRHIRQPSKSVIVGMSLVTSGSVTRAAQAAAKERGIEIIDRGVLARWLNSEPCTLLDVRSANSKRLASMRDVQAWIEKTCE